MRLFKDEPKWTPLNRGVETEGNKFRREYVEKREVGFRGCDGEREREQAREEVEKRLRSE